MTRPVPQARNGAKVTHTPQWQGGDWHWQEKAACAQVDESTQCMFTSLPERNKRSQVAEQTKALVEDYCSHCPVLKQCRAWADSDLSFVGVAGGRPYHDRVGVRVRDRGKQVG